MKTKFLTGITLALALLAAGPAFAHGGRDGGGGSVGAISRGSGGSGRSGGISSSAYSGGRSFASDRGFASGRAFSSGRTFSSRPSIAYGGNSYNSSRNYSRGGGGRYAYAFGSRRGWSPGREYSWNGHHYRWYNNGWFIIDPYPYDYGYTGYGYGYGGPAYTVYGSSDSSDDGGSVSVQVQRELARDGYYRGPIDGIIGPGTRAAIAAYQRDNGLRPTGSINSRLLDSLDLD